MCSFEKKNGWELLEAKSSTKIKDEHYPDISIQSFIVRKCLREFGQELVSCKVIHINKILLWIKVKITKI